MVSRMHFLLMYFGPVQLKFIAKNACLNAVLSSCSQRASNVHNVQISVAGLNVRTHSGRVTHICVGNLTIIGSDNGLSPGRRQAII